MPIEHKMAYAWGTLINQMEGSMRNGNLEQQTVDQVMSRVSGASDILRGYGIDPSSRMPQVRQPVVVDEEVAQELVVGA